MSEPSTTEKANAFLYELIEGGGAKIWQPKPGFAERLLESAELLGICGARVFDLQIALTARENGATQIFTHDSLFVKIPGLQVIDPL